MPAIASDVIPIEKGQHLRLVLDGTEITVAWVDPDGTVTDTDGDEWDPRDLEHMPPTYADRREVARRLRELDYSDLQESLICAYLDALDIDGYKDWVGIAHHLADLIEPEPHAEEIVAKAYRAAADQIDWELGDTPRVMALRERADELERMAHERDAVMENHEHTPKCSEPTPKCDRDALLALADEMKEETGSVCGVCMGKSARRIREALEADRIS